MVPGGRVVPWAALASLGLLFHILFQIYDPSVTGLNLRFEPPVRFDEPPVRNSDVNLRFAEPQCELARAHGSKLIVRLCGSKSNL